MLQFARTFYYRIRSTRALVDISSVSSDRTVLHRAIVGNALSSLQQHGIVIIKNAFRPARAAGFVENTLSYCSYIESCMKAGHEPQFNQFYGFNKAGLAVNITALDPVTQATQRDDFTSTTFFQTVMNDYVLNILKSVMGTNVAWTVARVRVVLPARAPFDGRLALHMEKTDIGYPGIHNIWAPITPSGSVSNVDIPGIQFLIGKERFCRDVSDEGAVSYFKSLDDQRDGEVLPIDKDAFLYRPAMQTGDVAIFNEYMPHGGHIPSGAKAARASCDFRVFPWSDSTDPQLNARLEPVPFRLAS